MTDLEAEAKGTCANCGRSRLASELDGEEWCGDCRREVVRRATLVAHLLGGLGGAGMGLWIILVIQPGPRFMLVWLVLVGLVYFFLYKLARRVAFEVIRSRGVTLPTEE